MWAKLRAAGVLVGFVIGFGFSSYAGAGVPAKQILDATGVKGGLVVHVGCGGGEFTAQLRATDSFLVHGLDANAASVANARERIRKLGLYGKVSVDVFDGRRLPYVGNFVNLVVAEDLRDVPMTEVMRVLCPNGVAYVKTTGGPGRRSLGEGGRPGRRSLGEGGWKKTVKPWPKEIDEWTHFLHGADGNPVAKDRRVGPPHHVQWMCGPRWSKHHEKFPPTIPVLVSAGGRVFYLEDETPAAMFNVQAKWYLTARDAFNGVLLWRRAMPNWSPRKWHKGLGSWGSGPMDYKRRLVAAGGRVYVAPGPEEPVTALDAATGRTVRAYGQGATHTEILFADGVLYVARKTVAAYQADSGKKLWDSPGGQGIAVSDGRVFFLAGGQIGALDATTGRQSWKVSPTPAKPAKGRRRGRARLVGPLRAGAGVVLVNPGDRGSVLALAAETGKLLWRRSNQGFRTWFRPVNAHIIDGLVWMTAAGKSGGDVRDDYLTVGLDPMTGKVTRSVPCGQAWNSGHHQRCYPTKATERYFIYSRRGADFVNLQTGKVTLNNWTRGACTYGVMPCNGLLYSPPHACRCYSETALRGLHAMATMRAKPAADETSEPNRLQSGPARSGISGLKSQISEGDWPTYRHDASRSGRTALAVSAEGLKTVWQANLGGGRLSGVVVAAGRAFVASVDTHTVHALDADTGKALWSYTAGGRVDSPPTIHAGLALFGCEDGWVYCLRADDGRLVWRFRAAPRDRRVGAFGQLASVWPVHGSVLVKNGPSTGSGQAVAYFAAGRNSYVDGGIYVFGLAATTGKKLHAHRLRGPLTGAGMTRANPNRGFVEPGALPDVLVADEERIYMRHMAFDPQLKTATDMHVNFWPAKKRAGEEFGGDHKFWCDIMDAPRLALKSKPEWYHRSYFYQWPGKRLYSTTGLMDDSWHIRSYWSYGQVVGQYLVFDADRAYAVKAYPNAARWLSYQAGQGYTLYAGKTAEPKGDQKLYALRPHEFDWSVKLPLRPRAMLLAKDTLFLAGLPDPADPAEALAALEGKRGALLWAVSAVDGKRICELKLDAIPTWDGLAAARPGSQKSAGGRLYLATTSGKVICLAGGK